MSAERKSAAVLYFQFSAFERHITEEVFHHAEGLGIGDDGGVRINLHEVVDVCRMIRLHVLDDEVIGFGSVQDRCDVIQPFMGEISIYSVHNGDLFILDHIGVVSHAVGNHILSLKQVYLVIVDAYIKNIIGYFHDGTSLLKIIFITVTIIIFDDFIISQDAGKSIINGKKFPIRAPIASFQGSCYNSNHIRGVYALWEENRSEKK